ncbi:DsbE family thiol:disulfide interchange protein [Ruegeria sediminis]|uniref:DsbE family thiol:disulfide interchange protein n=1 Tax=Ruegeria sediminis TaxID=2583820 RepID=A0ABY2WUT7_9RHOB|nr:DsbE family thiol:disulfide interchange protein [Ruegeria sediminis]TMV06374.1 DsbE family thiol:disulfide interchange protein [Ruegeria sediminis]
MAKISPLMIAPPLIFGAFVLLAAVGMFRDNKEELPTALAGKQAPAVELKQLGEKPLWTDEALRDGKIKLVNFWASWCAPCRVEHPNLEALQQEGITILGANYKDDPDNALAFMEELGDPYEAVGASEQSMNINWGVYGVPETFLVDGDGNIILRIAGPVTQRELTNRLRPAMEKAAGGQ